MSENDDDNTDATVNNDGLEDVALASVDQAIEAVENEVVETVPDPANEVIETPRDVIPEQIGRAHV